MGRDYRDDLKKIRNTVLSNELRQLSVIREVDSRAEQIGNHGDVRKDYDRENARHPYRQRARRTPAGIVGILCAANFGGVSSRVLVHVESVAKVFITAKLGSVVMETALL